MELFKDIKLQRQLTSEGYAVFPLLDLQSLAFFRQHLQNIRHQLTFRNGLHITSETSNQNLKEQINLFLCQYIEPHLEKVFSDFKVYQGSYIIKEGNSYANKVFPHQDWSFVDEKDGASSYTLWIALSDIKEGMGCIEIVSGSHLLPGKIRYTPNEAYHALEENRLHTDNLNFKRYELPAGHAMIWDHRLIHSSAPNQSSEDRMNIAFAITGNQSQLKLWWKDPNSDNILEFDVADNFYIRHNSEALYALYRDRKRPPGILTKELNQNDLSLNIH